MHPVLLRIGTFELPSYGILVACGIVAGLVVALRLAQRVDVSKDFVYDAVFWVVLAGLVGGRLTYVALEWRMFLEDPLGTLFAKAGHVFLGGLFAGVLALVVLCRRRGVALALAADVLAPGLALGHAFGRIGCFLAGCCYGAPSRSWLAVRFPKLVDARGQIIGSWPFLDHLEQGLVSVSDNSSCPVYPVQLFESAGNFLIFCGLLLLWRRRRFSGEVAAAYLIAYALLRFSLEFFRGDAIRGVWAGLSTSQWLSLCLLAAGLLVFWRAGSPERRQDFR